MATAEVKVTIRCRQFHGILTSAKCLVNLESGTVSVYDAVAHHYTLCHSLSKRDTGRVIAAAKKAVQS